MIRALVKDNLGWILGYSIGTSLYIFMIAAIYPSIAETGLIDAKIDSLPKELLDIFQYDPATMMPSKTYKNFFIMFPLLVCIV